jgi:hypothetical protein
MPDVGKHSGEPVEEVRPGVPRRRLLTLALGVTATLIAWGFLVWQAIQFGADARDDGGLAWAFLIFATIGATACLFATLVLISKLMGVLRGEGAPPPRNTPPGGRRAAR